MRREVDPDLYCPQAALVDEETARKAQRRLDNYRKRYEAAKRHEKMLIFQQHQRQQRLWMAGGTLVVVALSLFWYKRYSQKGSRRRPGGEGDGDVPRDLVLNEGDGFDGTEEELLQVFNEAAKVARSFPDGMLNQRDQLMVYGLYKQAREGDRSDDTAPSKINVVAYAKYDAWGKFKGLPKQFAMKKYCEVIYHFANGGKSAYNGKGSGDDNGDVVYDDDDKQQGDVDEDGCFINKNGDDDLGGMITGMGIKPSTMLGSTESKSEKADNASPVVRLHTAAMDNDVDALRKVMEDEYDVDAADEQGQTALHFAADRGSIDCLCLLIAAGANVNAADCDSIGVLQTALSAGLDVESVRLLLEGGANPDACDVDGDTPRNWVSEEGDKEMVDLFDSFPAR